MLLKCVYADAVLQDDDDACFRQLDASDCCEGGDLERNLALAVVPDDDFVLGELWGAAAPNKGDIICIPHHLG